MPRYERFDAGDPCWVELATSDPRGSASFYASVLGWSLQDMGPESGHYHLIAAGPLEDGGQATVGGLGAAEPGQRTSWIVYFNAPDLTAAHTRALEAGAASLVGPDAVMEQGSMALLADRQGATFGLWQPAGRLGFDAWGEPGTAAWFELHTTVLDEATEFYATVTCLVPHPMSGTPEFRYNQFAPRRGGADARFGAFEETSGGGQAAGERMRDRPRNGLCTSSRHPSTRRRRGPPASGLRYAVSPPIPHSAGWRTSSIPSERDSASSRLAQAATSERGS